MDASPHTPSDGETPFWHALSADEVMRHLAVEPDGLSEPEVERRLEIHGPNRLRIASPTSVREVLVSQVKSLVVVLLLVAAAISLLLGDYVEGAAIGAVLLINTALGFWTEWRARRAMEALRNLQVQGATARRAGRLQTIDAAGLVPGDVIVVESGSAIPADARLLTATELTTVEAPLTGESLTVAKSASPVTVANPERLPIAERTSILYKGTLVATGTAEAIVVGTGVRTEIGRIGELLQTADDERTPLERRLDRLGRRLVVLVLGLAALVVALGVWRGGDPWLVLETAIALAVAAVPEGLPVVATIALAVGVSRMAKRRALLRHLPSVETLGSTTVICTDKTGTLTAGEMTATTLWIGGATLGVTGSGYAEAGELQLDGQRVAASSVPGLELALRVAVLTNHARIGEADSGAGDEARFEGDPTEAALLVLARKAGVFRKALEELFPTIGEVPFSSHRRLMATFHRTPDDRLTAYVKGAPRRLVELSSSVLAGERTVPLDDAGRERLLEVNCDLAARGLRVLAIAERDLGPAEETDEAALSGLTLIGFVGIMDPPASDVERTVDRLREAGVRTVMITGDQVVTAEAVGRQLGVVRRGGQTLEGRELTELSDEALAARIGNVSAFARVSPEDKLRIVRAFQQRGEIVGMLGDGVNDAPALKQADIGVAMGGRGTDVAKENAEMVLSDDRFETVALAVEEGRVVFDNIRKFIFYLFSCNLSEALVVVTSVVVGLPLPLLPLQILWLNLVTDVFPALALAVEPAEPGLMARPPRDPKAAILSGRFTTQVATYGLLITGATFAAFRWALGTGDVDPQHPVTVAFMTLALAQLLHVFNARGDDPVLLNRRLVQNRWALRALLLTALLQLAAVYLPPLSRVLRTVPLGLTDWLVVVPAACLPLAVGQTYKALRRRRR